MVRKASWRLVGESLAYSLVASTIYLVTKVLVERSIEEWRLITRTMGVWEGLMGGLIFVAVVGTIRQRPPWVKFFVPWFLSTIFYLFVEGAGLWLVLGAGVSLFLPELLASHFLNGGFYLFFGHFVTVEKFPVPCISI